MKTFTDAEKEAIYEETLECFRTHEVWGRGYAEMPPFGRCVPWTACGIEVLRAHGHNAVLQAGSMQWPVMTRDQDDGVRATHFGFVWSPHTIFSQMQLQQKLLPEMHVWIALPNELMTSAEVVDFSTGGFKLWADAHGVRWTAPEPPKFLWQQKIPLDTIYKPNPVAISVVLAFIAHEEKAIVETAEEIEAYSKRFGLGMIYGPPPEAVHAASPN